MTIITTDMSMIIGLSVFKVPWPPYTCSLLLSRSSLHNCMEEDKQLEQRKGDVALFRFGGFSRIWRDYLEYLAGFLLRGEN